MQSCLPVLPTQSAPLAAHPAIFTVDPHGPIQFPATHFVDITPYHEHKIALMLNHAWLTDVLTAASLHLNAYFLNALYLEFNVSSSSLLRSLCKNPTQMIDGYITFGASCL